MTKKTILSISKLTGNESTGININIPKFVQYLNDYCNSGYLDCGSAELRRFNGFKNFFRTKDYEAFSIKKLPEPFNNPDFVVFQTLYIPEFTRIAKKLNEMGIPYTIIPRSSMTAAAQNKKKIKKRVGNILYFNKLIKNAKFIHFLSNNEYLESKKCFHFKDHVVIGNGIEMPKQFHKINNSNTFNINFIGRIDVYHKGLDLLLKAVSLDCDFFRKNNVIINIYGTDYENGINYLKQIIDNNNLKDIVFLHDGVFAEEKEKVLLNTDLFIHTSRMEGHPTGVIEAISYGIPVLVTPGTNVCDEVENEKLGFVSNSDIDSILSTIKKAFFERDNYNQINKNCIKYARENYDWRNICEKIMTEYFKK